MSDIIIKNLNISYGDKCIFDDFDIAFASGKISVILGDSGVGKTTLLNAIAGLVDSKNCISGAKDGVSYIFQKDRLIPTISVYKNLDLILRSQIKDRKERKQKILEIAKIVEIEDILSKKPTSISGGQAQRVAMARAFVYQSDILLLDEPFKALDLGLKTRLINKLISLNEVSKRTIIFVTHSIDECLMLADDFYIFKGTPVSVVLQESLNRDEDINDVRRRRIEVALL